MGAPEENIGSELTTRPPVPAVTNSRGSPRSSTSTTAGRCPMPFKLPNYETKHKFQDHLHTKTVPCEPDSCQGSVVNKISSHNPGIPYTKQELFTEAEDFLIQYYQSINQLDSVEHQTRWIDVRDDISLTGTYEHTYDELVFAAKTAWRNAPKCIGRQQWHKLEVFDHRHITSAQEMFDALCHHIKFSTNGGKIIPALTAFPQRRPGHEDFRLWNPQLIRYAGYLQPDGTVVGDPIGVEFTQACELLGWKGKGGRFDVLPLILQAPGNEPEWFELPSDIVMEVKLIHPRYDWFAELGLQWFVLPGVSGMMMDAGGIQYPSLPFSGWYMSTEIGARDLCDVQRYNVAYDVADKMGLDTSNNTTLWKDQVLIECNIAVLHSFQRAGATIQDHHTLSESFMRHFKQETQLRGGCPSDWLWIVPPMSGSLCTVYHQEMMLYDVKPGYYWQGSPWRDLLKKQRKVRSCPPWKMLIPAIKFYSNMVLKLRNSRQPCTILYASESGKSEAFAHRIMETMNKMFRTTVSLMDDYNVQDLKEEKFILFVTSTYGSGDPPQNGKAFFKKIKKLASTCTPALKRQMKFVRYSIFGLGSTAYPGTYCQFAETLNTIMQGVGATQIANIGLGDELNHQEQSFVQWANIVTKTACRVFDISQEAMQGVLLEGDTQTWTASTFRTMPTATGRSADILPALAKIHRKELHVCKLKSRKQLQAPNSRRQTIEISLDLSSHPQLRYRAGDHVGVLPANEKSIVDSVLAAIVDCPSPQNAVTLEVLKKNEWRDHRRFPAGLTMQDALTYVLDLTTPPTQRLLQLMSTVAKNEKEKTKLLQISENPEEYTKWKHYYWPNLPEVLSQFPSIELPSSLVLSEFPVLQPRLYSISSSQQSYSKEVHLTMGVTKYRTQEGRGPVHKGVTTNYLNQLKEGENVTIFFRESEEFHLPKKSMVPVVLVGAGSGIAPLRAFWQEKYANINKRQGQRNGIKQITPYRGDMTLFFGCRGPNEDDVYADEIKSMEKKGVITEAFKAYSRVKNKEKTYVQDMVRQQDHLVYQSLVNEDGHLYICGSTNMAVGVKQALKDIIQNYQQVAAPEAEEVIQALRDEDRIHEDIFGGNDYQLPVVGRESEKIPEMSKPYKNKTDTAPTRGKPRNQAAKRKPTKSKGSNVTSKACVIL